MKTGWIIHKLTEMGTSRVCGPLQARPNHVVSVPRPP